MRCSFHYQLFLSLHILKKKQNQNQNPKNLRPSKNQEHSNSHKRCHSVGLAASSGLHSEGDISNTLILRNPSTQRRTCRDSHPLRAAAREGRGFFLLAEVTSLLGYGPREGERDGEGGVGEGGGGGNDGGGGSGDGSRVGQTPQPPFFLNSVSPGNEHA